MNYIISWQDLKEELRQLDLVDTINARHAEKERLALRQRTSVRMRMKPLHARAHKAARLRRQRMLDNRVAAAKAAHVRQIEREGSTYGTRCHDCHHIPLKPWEQPLDPPEVACACGGNDPACRL